MAETIRGMAELKRAFQRLPEVTQQRLYDTATWPTASGIARIAGGRVAVRFGHVKRAIGFTASRKTGFAKVGVRRELVTIAGQRLPENTAKVAGHLEFGTKKMAARPFMFPAAEAEKNNYLARCRAAGREIERDLSVSSLL